MNPKLFGWYVKFPGALLLYMIFFQVTLETDQNKSLKRKIEKMDNSMPLVLFYHKNEPIILNANSFVNLEVVS